MANYVVSYDYHKHRDYTKIYHLLNHVGAVRILESMWLVSVNVTAPELRDAMIACGDGDESYVVLELVREADWATIRAPGVANQWLSDNVAVGQLG